LLENWVRNRASPALAGTGLDPFQVPTYLLANPPPAFFLLSCLVAGQDWLYAPSFLHGLATLVKTWMGSSLRFPRWLHTCVCRWTGEG